MAETINRARPSGASTFGYEHDGLRLSGRLHGFSSEGRRPAQPGVGTFLPLVCLPGLTRNARDFDAFAAAIQAGDHPRQVVAFDYRGRGRSDHASPETYAIPVEAADILAGLDHLGIERAIFVGTSRGALIVHVLALTALRRIAGAVLNDAGPRLEVDGLRLIRDTVGRRARFTSWAEAADDLEARHAKTFSALGRPDFERMARATHVERGGGIVADCDPALIEAIGTLDLDKELPELWDAYERLKVVPVLTIRGANSMLLAASTLDRMSRDHPRFAALTVAGQGHAPFLETAGLPERIAAFADTIDAVGLEK